MTEELTYLERYTGNCPCYRITVNDSEAELESWGVLVVNQRVSHKAGKWPLVLSTSAAVGFAAKDPIPFQVGWASQVEMAPVDTDELK